MVNFDGAWDARKVRKMPSAGTCYCRPSVSPVFLRPDTLTLTTNSLRSRSRLCDEIRTWRIPHRRMKICRRRRIERSGTYTPNDNCFACYAHFACMSLVIHSAAAFLREDSWRAWARWQHDSEVTQCSGSQAWLRFCGERRMSSLKVSEGFSVPQSSRCLRSLSGSERVRFVRSRRDGYLGDRATPRSPMERAASG
jgi:hypothetical protein